MLKNFASIAPHSTPCRSTTNSSAAPAQDIELEWLNPAAWDELAAGFEDVRQEHINAFATAKWGMGRLERVSMRRNGEVIGGAIVITVLVPQTNRGIAIVKWGPLWRRQHQQPDFDNLKLSIIALEQEYVERRGLFLSILPQVDPDYSQAIVEELKGLGFSAGSRLPSPERYFINTSISPDDLLSSLDQKWRYNLKKSRKADLTIDWAVGNEGLANFMHLYEQMLDRKNFHDTSAIATLGNLVHCDVKALRPKIVMAYHQDTPTAGAVIDISGDCAVYLYGATDDRALQLRAGYALHWWIAEWLCQQPQIRCYDMGGSDGDRGLHQFKKGFVGKQGVILDTPESRDTCASIFGSAVGKSIFAARDFTGYISRQIHRTKSGFGG